MSSPVSNQSKRSDDEIDFGELFARLRRGLPLITALALIGLAVAALVFVSSGAFLNTSTTIRVVFSFPGFEKGEYPDGSKFTPDDLRSPEIVAAALKRKSVIATDEIQGKIRAALSVVGLIPDSIVKERDRQRAAGLTPRTYIPDEYSISLSLPRASVLNTRQRKELLTEIVSLYREKFIRTYITLPLSMGKAFESLSDADYFDYDIVLFRESENISTFLTNMADKARAFRSPRTGLTFNDLLQRSQIFSQIRLNEVLGLIRRDGLSKNRVLSLVKMDYYIKNLSDDEKRAIQEEEVVQKLLQQTQERNQNYTLGLKTQTGNQRSDSLIVDQGLVDSLLANDSYNFLVREALESSLKTRRIQSDKAIMEERREVMLSFIESDKADKSNVFSQFEESLVSVSTSYENLISSMRDTYEDYQKQEFGDAIRISMQTKTENFYLQMAIAGFAGLGIGCSLGMGLSLFGLGLSSNKAI